jgi:MFS family permease
VAADRLPRRMIILWSDGGRGIIVLIISILGLTGTLQFWHLVIEALVFGIVDGFFNPAIMAITPDLVAKDDLTSANSLNVLSNNLAQLLGPMLGAGLIALLTPAGAFAANALSFFISFAFLISVAIPERHVKQASEDGAEEQPAKEPGMRGVIADVKEGLVYVRNSRWISVTMLNAAINNIGLMATLAVAMPKLVHDVYGQGAWLLGLISAAGAIGSLLGLPFIALATRLKRRGLLAYLGFSLTFVGLIIFGLPFPHVYAPFIAPFASILVGFGLTAINTIWFTVLHETIPNEKLGRVLSLDVLATFATIPLGEALGGVLTDHIGPAAVFLIFGIFNLVNVLFPLLVREVREME